MQPNYEEIKLAITTLKTAKKDISKLLASSPELQNHFLILFSRVITAFCVVVGEPVSAEDTDDTMNFAFSKQSTDQPEEPLTHIFGKPIASQKAFRRDPKEAKPADSEVSDFQYQVNIAYEDVQVMEAKDFLLKYGEFPLVIKGMAKKAGHKSATGSEPNMNADFITKIQSRIKEGQDLETTVAEIKNNSTTGEQDDKAGEQKKSVGSEGTLDLETLKSVSTSGVEQEDGVKEVKQPIKTDQSKSKSKK